MAERPQEEGWHEPYELRGSRTDLWGTGGEIPPVYPTVIYNHTEIRYHALINNSAWSVLYKNEVFQRLEKEQHHVGFFKKVWDDGKIDLYLQEPGPEKVDDVLGRIIVKPKARGGFISVMDTNPPETIHGCSGQARKHTKKRWALFKKTDYSH